MAKIKEIKQATKAAEKRLRERQRRDHAIELGFHDMEHYDMWEALEKLRKQNLELRAAQKHQGVPIGSLQVTLPKLHGYGLAGRGPFVRDVFV